MKFKNIDTLYRQDPYLIKPNTRHIKVGDLVSVEPKNFSCYWIVKIESINGSVVDIWIDKSRPTCPKKWDKLLTITRKNIIRVGAGVGVVEIKNES